MPKSLSKEARRMGEELVENMRRNTAKETLPPEVQADLDAVIAEDMAEHPEDYPNA